MSLLNSVMSAITGGSSLGQGAGGVQGALLNAVVGMLAGGQGQASGAASGGLGELIGKFTQGGMGDVIGSWIGTGQNAPISADQLTSVLGSDTIGNLASQLGLSNGDVAGQLSQLLPQVIDKLTPDGQTPTGGLGGISDILSQLTARANTGQ